ncbi:sugar phosphate isomerase/epimerase [Streptomyces sp. NPDC088354]|uniref:sugar phosphate isomerase/epimerase family protein n=1 Tax=unclassified Streptomyces TaxID=2593676 RepID=UPI0029BB9258|nr:sugar phosphate isomerase/epimerase [Streptomyces sp. MI02-7b]MDX3074681.1 sugar phosphate isomerase/epimerase [Streptomyces sp. MI02-7b]
MKLAFSTLGVPGLPMADVARLAAEHGWHGVELRAGHDEPVHAGLTERERASVRGEFRSAGVGIVAVASYVQVAAPGEDEPVLRALRDHVRLAAGLGAPHLRVFPGAGNGSAPDAADTRAAGRLAAVAPEAADLGVRLLLETHDSHRTGADVARVLGLVGHHSTGALWDVLHPWLAGEQPEYTYPVLAPYLGYVQVKDVSSAQDTTPVPLGHGTVPLAGTVEVLSRAGWDGWLCWEYERRWYPQVRALPELLSRGRSHLLGLLGESA